MVATHKLMNVFLRRAWTGQFTTRPCMHLDMVNDVQQPPRCASSASPLATAGQPCGCA
jgi:hypothetical protein